MIPPQVRAIFFDAVGTLIHPEPAAATVYAEVGRRFGSKRGLDEIQARFAAAFQREEEADRAGGMHTSEEREFRRWRHIVAEVLGNLGDLDGCFQELYRHFALPGAWRLEEGVSQALKVLSQRGYVLGMASNYDGRLRSVIAGMPELHRLGHLVISSEVGWRKPAPEFFAALAHSVEMEAGHILFVGDDYANDYEGAASAGMHALLFDPLGKSRSLACRRLERLAELTEP